MAIAQDICLTFLLVGTTFAWKQYKLDQKLYQNTYQWTNNNGNSYSTYALYSCQKKTQYIEYHCHYFSIKAPNDII